MLDEFIIAENSMKFILMLFTNICDEASCKFFKVNVVKFIVEKLLSSKFTWLLKVVMILILFCECTIRMKINFTFLFDEVALSVIFDYEWIAKDYKIFSISCSFLESRRIFV